MRVLVVITTVLLLAPACTLRVGDKTIDLPRAATAALADMGSKKTGGAKHWRDPHGITYVLVADTPDSVSLRVERDGCGPPTSVGLSAGNDRIPLPVNGGVVIITKDHGIEVGVLRLNVAACDGYVHMREFSRRDLPVFTKSVAVAIAEERRSAERHRQEQERAEHARQEQERAAYQERREAAAAAREAEEQRLAEKRQQLSSTCGETALAMDICASLARGTDGFDDLQHALAKRGYEMHAVRIRGKLGTEGDLRLYEVDLKVRNRGVDALVAPFRWADAIVVTPQDFAGPGDAFAFGRLAGKRQVRLNNGFDAEFLVVESDRFSLLIMEHLFFGRRSEADARASHIIEGVKTGAVVVPEDLRE